MYSNSNFFSQTQASQMERVATATIATTIGGTPDDDESGAQISFLNSIIADMQKKNENLLLRIETLEAGPADFVK